MMVGTQDIQHRLKLVELDYAATCAFVQSIQRTLGTLRGWSITAWLAVMGVGANQKSPELASVSLLVPMVFALMDVRQQFLYLSALRHAVSLENVLRLGHRALVRGDEDPHSKQAFEVQLQAASVGLYHSLDRFAWHAVRWSLVHFLYYGMFVLGLVFTLALWWWLNLRHYRVPIPQG